MFPAVTPIPAGLSDRLALILDGLCRAIAARMVRNPTAVPLLMLACIRLRRAAVRFAALAARASAGTLLQPRTNTRRPANPAHLPRPKQRLPGGFAWLFRLVPEAACSGSQLQHLLSDPEMATLLEAAPQAGRILRPLCRMLAVRPIPAVLRPPPPSRPESPNRPATPAEPPPAARTHEAVTRPRPYDKEPCRGIFAGLPPPARA